MQRNPAVSGTFYSSDKDKLRREIAGYLDKARVSARMARGALAYVAPHAGYKYSGHTAAFTYKALGMRDGIDTVDAFVIIGPNHTGFGYPISISEADWKTPLGIVSNDLELSREIASQSDRITIDEDAHRMEHSIEVQLPFLQTVVRDPKCCFICMGNQSLDYCRNLYSAIDESAKKLKRKAIIIASSDFNHYESAQTARRKDMEAMEELKTLKFEGFHNKIRELEDSACGYGPVTVSAMFAKSKGANSGIVLKYSNSGEITKNYDSVVAYSSVAFI